MLQPSRSSLPRWIALGTVLALALGVAAAARQWRVVRPAPSGDDGAIAVADTALGAGDETAIEQALRLTPGSGEDPEKERWVGSVPGVDLGGLDDGQIEVFVRFANAQRCTCGCGYTLAGCRTYDPTCEVSLPRVQALLDSVRAGHLRSAEGIRRRPPRG